MNFVFTLQTASKDFAMALEIFFFFFNFLQLIFVTGITHCSICHLKNRNYIFHLALSECICQMTVYTLLVDQNFKKDTKGNLKLTPNPTIFYH